MVDNPVGEQVIVVQEEVAETNHLTLFILCSFFSTLSDCIYLSVAAAAALMRSLVRLWTVYYPRLVAIPEEAEMLPRSTLSFIIAALIAFAQIKSQGETGFPFQSHPQAIMVAVTTLLVYGLASAAEHVISATGVDPISVYVIIIRLGRIASLCILMASLACMFYF